MNAQAIRKDIRKWISKPETSSLLIFLLMLLITVLLQKNFFESKSLVRSINAFAPLILMTMGQAIVMISGTIDLSAGPALSLMTCVLTYIMKTNDPVTGVTAFVVTLLVAVLIGVINGFGAGYLRIPPVILTFATSYMWLGAALFIRPTPGGQTVDWFKAFYDFGSVKNAPAGLVAFGKVIPPALLLVLIGCVLWYILSKTRTGRYLYAVGSNGDSAYASGINTAKLQMKAFILNALYIFLASLFFVGQNLSGDARMGDPMTLKAIAAAVVGGIAMSGGRGSVYFAIIGALIMSLVNKIIFFANIPNAYQTLVSGLIVVAAISSSMIYTKVSHSEKNKENA